jgi:tetratricopeptide (TPR) repeat protein
MKRCSVQRWPVMAAALVGLLCAAAASAQTASVQTDPFYLKLLSQGESLYHAQKFEDAAKTLDVACFGLSQDAARLGTALGYMSLSYFNLKNDTRAREILVRLIDLVGLNNLATLAMADEDRGHIVELAAFYKLNVSATGTVAPARVDSLRPSPTATPGAGAAPAEMIKTLEAKVKAQPKNVQAYLDLYEYKIGQKDIKGARRALERLADNVPSDPTARLLLGKMDFADKDFDDAADRLEKYLSLRKDASAGDKDYAEAEAALIVAYNNLKKRPQLDKACRDFLSRFAPEAVLSTGLADNDKNAALAVLGKYATPKETAGAPSGAPPVSAGIGVPVSGPGALQREIKKNPKNVSLYYGLYDYYRQKNDRSAARQVLENLVKTNPFEAKAYLDLGRLSYAGKDYSHAAEMLGKVFKLPSGFSVEAAVRNEAAFYLVLSLLRNRETDKAQETFAIYRTSLLDYLGSGATISDSDMALWQKLRQDIEAAGLVYLLGIRVDDSPAGLEVKIDLSGETNYRTFILTKERSVVIELFRIAGSRAPEKIEINRQGVKAVRTSLFQKETARVILDGLGQIPSHRIIKTDSGLSIVIEKSSPGL